MAMSLWHCAGRPSRRAYVKNGKEYGKVSGAFFRHRWWNYYERGLSFAEGKFFPEAVSDLEEAIQQREKDQRMARTYGMHFMDYFPHRELGIVYYETGDLEVAKRELEVSLSHFPSAKAYFYLDRVRKALIEGLKIEVPPPKLTLSFTTYEMWTREDPVVLAGVAEDESYVAGVTIRGVPLFLEGSKARLPFEERLNLSQGAHTIDVVAGNLLGKTTKRQVVIHVDREGPTVTLGALDLESAVSGKEATVSGWIYDEAGVSDLSINGQTIPIETGVDVPFTARLTVYEHEIELATHDRLGNETSASIPLVTPAAAYSPVLVAWAGSGKGLPLMAGLFGPKDQRPPIIRLKGWAETQTVFLEKVYIEGQVSDESKIEALTVNGASVLHRKGRHIFFAHMAELKEGENILTVAARDEFGHRASKQITVIRRVPKALQLNERLSLTTFPFDQKGAVSEASLVFQDNLIDALVHRNRFRVVEREKLDLILKEQKLSRTRLFDQHTALKLGRLVAALSVITGSIIETRTGIEVVARMIDSETSEVLSTQDVYGELKALPALRSLAEGMAIKFHRDFPLVDGLVIEQRGKDIFTDLGQDLVKLQRRLIVYQQEPVKHPLTGKVLGKDNKIMGRARISQVMPEMSKARLLDGKTEAIRRLDRVISE
jgi:hypothetical protein